MNTREINQVVTIGGIVFQIVGALHANGEFYGDITNTIEIRNEDGAIIPAREYISISMRGKRFKYVYTVESARGITEDKYFFDTYAEMRNRCTMIDMIMNRVK